jgi:glutaredoxin-like protein
MDRLLNDDVVSQVKGAFQELKEPVKIVFFDSDSCEYCEDTRQLLREVAEISKLINLEEYHLDEDAELAEKYRVDKAPGLLIGAPNGEVDLVDYGIRFAGIPSGHEFTTLIQDLLMVSSRDAGLNPATMDYLNELDEPVHLQVFVTPTCPYCPRAVILAHRLAFASENIQSEMVETSEFMDLAQEYQVSGVPDTSINHGTHRVVGAVPEENLIEEIQKALSQAKS